MADFKTAALGAMCRPIVVMDFIVGNRDPVKGEKLFFLLC